MKMKLVSLSLLGAMLVSGAAAALDCDPRFYVGGELQLNNQRFDKQNFGWSLVDGTANGKTIKKTRTGLDLIVGSRVTENFGVEAGYAFLGNTKLHDRYNYYSTKVRARNAHIDAMGYVPVSCDVNLIGSLGVGRLTTKVTNREDGITVPLDAATKRLYKARTGLRVGLGAEYKIDENLSARLMARHQKGNKVIKNVNSLGLGLFYTF